MFGLRKKKEINNGNSFTVRNITLDEVKDIYDKHIYNHFPKEEVKPLKNIIRMWEARKYFAFGMFDQEGDLLGYALLCDAATSEFALLDYYAMTSIARGKGYGSEFLKQITKKIEGYIGIIIETEAVDFAKNDEDRRIRTSRNHFYEMNGAVMTGVRTSTFGVIYDIWCLKIMQTYYDKQDIVEALDDIYSVMVDDKQMKKENFWFI